MNTKQTIAVVALIVGTLAAGWVLLSAPDSPATDEQGHGASELGSEEPEQAEDSVAPRHGGRVFTIQDTCFRYMPTVRVTIYLRRS